MSIPVFLDARRSALDGLVDYAGLFPPAGLEMDAAVAGYREARRHDARWMVDRFICPAVRLEELAGVLVASMPDGEPPWPVSVLAGPAGDDWARAAADDASRAAVFAAEMAPAAYVDLVEVQIPPSLAGSNRLGGEIGRVLDSLGGLGPIFFELSRGPVWESTLLADLEALAETRRRRSSALGAKLRCGGLSRADFPSPEDVARFIVGCAALEIPFKATAGLHQPIRHYDPESGFTRHGFLNLLIASALAATHGLPTGAVTEIVADTDAANFSLTRRVARWRDLDADAAALAAVRLGLFRGYGSCDFTEPVDALTELGVLPVRASV